MIRAIVQGIVIGITLALTLGVMHLVWSYILWGTLF